MALRKIVKIDEDKCDGCGLCANACAEGAIKIVDGKARLVSEVYCDGLGACIGQCPRDAITIEKRQAAEFSKQATKKHLAEIQKTKTQAPAGQDSAPPCPGIAVQTLQTEAVGEESPGNIRSQLSHWPVQLKLVPPNAAYLADADLILAADCVPFAMGDFHNRFLRGRKVVVGCPKLDDADFYVEKLAAILKVNTLQSLTVVHMVVPCCFGLTHIAREAVRLSGARITFQDVTVDLHGNVTRTESIKPE